MGFLKREQPKPIQQQHENFIRPTAMVQAKLQMGKAGDKFEKEADATADKVVNKTSGNDTVQKQATEEEQVQQKPIASGITSVQKKDLEGEKDPVQAKGEASEEEPVQAKGVEEEEPIQTKGQEEEESLQAKEESDKETDVQRKEEETENDQEALQAKGEEEESLQAKAVAAPKQKSANSIESKLKTTKGNGQTLGGKAKQDMESGFGADFSNVKIHTDAKAAEMSEQIGAQAFTHGNDVYFNQGKYDPESTEGKALLAHELTHTIQQEGANEKEASASNETAIEKDSDEATMGFMQRMLSGGKEMGKKIMPKLKGGLRISRCQSDKAKEKIKELTPEQKKRLLLNKKVQEKIKAGDISFKDMDKEEGHDNKTFNSYHFKRIMDYRKGNWDREDQVKAGTCQKGYGEKDYHDCVTSFSHTISALYNKKFKTFNYSQAEQYFKNGKLRDGAYEDLKKKKYVSTAKDFFMLSKDGNKGSENNKVVTKFDESPAAWALSQSKTPGIHVFGVSVTKGYHTMNMIVDTRGGGQADFYVQDQHRSSINWDRSIAHTASEVDNYFLKMGNDYSSAKGHRKVKLFKFNRVN